MKTNLLKKYSKHIVLMLLLSMNIYINFTHNNFPIGIKYMLAQESGGSWDYGVGWLDDLLDVTNFAQGTYFNQGDGNWGFCSTCVAAVVMEEIVVYADDLSNQPQPIKADLSDLYWNPLELDPILNKPIVNYWDYDEKTGNQLVPLCNRRRHPHQGQHRAHQTQ
jgi:hypothetical protein